MCVRLQCLARLAVATASKQVSTHVIWIVNKNVVVEGLFPLRSLKIHYNRFVIPDDSPEASARGYL